MTTLSVTAKGQVTFRKDLLKHLGVVPGERLTVNKLPNGRIEVAAAYSAGPVSGIFDLLKRDGQPSFSIDELNEIVAQGWSGKR